ncbi:hypothetical protein FRB99_007371 [Tulasnella sp. 403]|nr:hypothetical protein FRB99_007371 [Tulasnella sp. 403]
MATPQDIQNHLYNAFLNRATTDVTIRVRAKDWSVAYDLHRVVLIQSGFFRSLFTHGFRESSRHSSDGTDVIPIQFDDPNITRAAFEICIAQLYGGGPSLHVPPSLVPTTSQPLTPSYLSTSPYIPPPSGHHPATPRFLLSLIATSVYLSIPAVTSNALSLVLSTIGPTTVIRYLNFALGNGIGGTAPGDLDSAIGLENVGRDLPDDANLTAQLEASERLSVSETTDDAEATSSSGGAETDEASSQKHGCAGADDVPSGATERRIPLEPFIKSDIPPLFNYGIVSNKIGEACACWLARWATDIFPYEEDYHYSLTEKGKSTADARPGPVTTFLLTHTKTPARPSSSSAQPDPSSFATHARRATISSVSVDPTINDSTATLASSVHSQLLGPNSRPPAIWSRSGGLPARWVRGLFSSDDLFIKGGERERYDFATRVVELRRREAKASALMHSGETEWASGLDEEEEKEWEELFATGFYFSHMSFDDLLHIQNDVSPTTGKPFVPLSALQSAHWNQSVFRSHIMSMPSVGSPRSGSPNLQGSSQSPAKNKSAEASPTSSGWQDTIVPTLTTDDIVDSMVSRPDAPSQTKRSYFPVLVDGSHRFGGDIPKDAMDSLAQEAVGSTTDLNRSTTRKSLQPTKHLDERNFFGLALNGRRTAEDIVAEMDEGRVNRWTETEPCRFSVEFWGVESLKPSHRLYSNTVWCMGSLWNVYVQIVRKKGLQLGVYLQRQSFVDSIPPHSVPYLPGVRGNRTDTPTQATAGMVALHPSVSMPTFSGGHGADRPHTPVPPPSNASPRSRPWAIPYHTHSTTAFPLVRSLPNHAGSPTPTPMAGTSVPTSSPMNPISSQSQQSQQPLTCPSTAPNSPYRDPRQSIRAYFSISCPSATGASSTKFCSAPDFFNVTQSWGWKSSKAEEWVDFEAVEAANSSATGATSVSQGSAIVKSEPKMECSLRATIVLGVV